jgi:hypothetical protein
MEVFLNICENFILDYEFLIKNNSEIIHHFKKNWFELLLAQTLMLEDINQTQEKIDKFNEFKDAGSIHPSQYRFGVQYLLRYKSQLEILEASLRLNLSLYEKQNTVLVHKNIELLQQMGKLTRFLNAARDSLTSNPTFIQYTQNQINVED